MGSLAFFLLQVVFGAWFMASQPKTKFVIIFWKAGLVGLTGLEPVTLRLSSACSNQLSYRP
jgi:hypothetical protein